MAETSAVKTVKRVLVLEDGIVERTAITMALRPEFTTSAGFEVSVTAPQIPLTSWKTTWVENVALVGKILSGESFDFILIDEGLGISRDNQQLSGSFFRVGLSNGTYGELNKQTPMINISATHEIPDMPWFNMKGNLLTFHAQQDFSGWIKLTAPPIEVKHINPGFASRLIDLLR